MLIGLAVLSGQKQEHHSVYISNKATSVIKVTSLHIVTR